MKESLYAAADIGATGIKMAAAVYDGRKLRIVDTYSEPNLPKVKDGHEFADTGHMLKTIRDGLGWLGENGRLSPWELIPMETDTAYWTLREN